MSQDNSTSTKRLRKELADFKKERPCGFTVKLGQKSDGTLDYHHWMCQIPGPEKSPWEGGVYKINLNFPQEYPALPPKCVFEMKLFHPNVYPSGAVCLSIINEEEDWRASLKVKDILVGIRQLLKNPNEKSPAQKEAYEVYVNNKEAYRRKVREQANQCKPK